jgi:hypothetical protein
MVDAAPKTLFWLDDKPVMNDCDRVLRTTSQSSVSTSASSSLFLALDNLEFPAEPKPRNSKKCAFEIQRTTRFVREDFEEMIDRAQENKKLGRSSKGSRSPFSILDVCGTELSREIMHHSVARRFVFTILPHACGRTVE